MALKDNWQDLVDGESEVNAKPINDIAAAVIELEDELNSGTSITVDAELSGTSTNPVQNKVVAEAFETVVSEFENVYTAIEELQPDENLSATSHRPIQNGTVAKTIGFLNEKLFNIEEDLTASKVFAEEETLSGFILANGNLHAEATLYRSTDFVALTMPRDGSITIKSTINLYCSLAFYDKNKAVILGIDGNNIADYGYTANAYPQERNLPVPEETAYIRFSAYAPNGLNEGDLYYRHKTNISALEAETRQAKEELSITTSITDGFIEDISLDLEYGNIGMTNNGWGYANSTSRVRTKQGDTIKLFAGSEISVSDGIRFYVGWRTSDGYNHQGWITGSSFVAPVDGEYVLLFTYISEADIDDIDYFINNITVKRKYYYGSFAQNIDNAVNPSENFAINPNVVGVSHRGYNFEAPENTIPAFILARKKGFVCIECDVDYTSDDELVIIHDTTINRTARNADGTEITDTLNIRDITYEQALTYDFGIFKGKQFAGTTIPKFEEFIRLCKAIGAHPYIELKFTGRDRNDLIKPCCDIVKKYGMAGKTTWIHTEVPTLGVIAQNLPSERLGLVCYKHTFTETAMTALKNLKTDKNEVFVDICFVEGETLDDVVELCISNEVALETWTVNTKERLMSLNPYISGVTSDLIVAEKVLYEAYI